MSSKVKIFLFSILLLLDGCTIEPPPESEMEKLTHWHLQALNLPFEITEINFFPKEYNRKEKYYPVTIKVKANILDKDKKNIIYTVDNTYFVKFHRILYEYWLAHFNLVREAPVESIVKDICSEKFSVDKKNVEVISINSIPDNQYCYPVEITIKNKGTNSTFTLPFHQDEFGIWHIGVSKLITPESTVRSFLSEVNEGNTDKARRYFSYGYKLGYDELDQKNLEELFPVGSIKDVAVSDVITRNDTANLNLTVVKTNLDTFKTNLEFIKLGIEWRFNYNGWDWKFKPADSINLGSTE